MTNLKKKKIELEQRCYILIVQVAWFMMIRAWFVTKYGGVVCCFLQNKKEEEEEIGGDGGLSVRL